MNIHRHSRTHSRRPILGAIGLGLASCIAGCNTIDGIGADLREASSATQRALSSDNPDDQPRTASTNDGSNPDR